MYQLESNYMLILTLRILGQKDAEKLHFAGYNLNAIVHQIQPKYVNEFYLLKKPESKNRKRSPSN